MSCKYIYKGKKYSLRDIRINLDNILKENNLTARQVLLQSEIQVNILQSNNPVIAFQNQAGITKAEAIKRNNGNPLNLAPNGKPSILYQSYLDLGYSVEEAERLTAQTFSDSFGEWFDGSQVVDSNGQPLIMWHNTDTDFTEYSFQEKGKNTSFGGSVGKGIYTTTKERAEGYGGKYNKPLFLNIRNPRTANISYSDSAINLAIRLVNEEIDKSDYPDKNYAKRNAEFDIRDKMQKGITPYVSGYFTSTIITEVNKAEGFDGVFDGSSDKVVFNPNQIKSATENIGTFDSGSNDIRFSIVGEKGATNLDAQEEATYRIDNLGVAREMEQSGKTPKEIRLATGWERGADGDWRYEIEPPRLKVGTQEELNKIIENGEKTLGNFTRVNIKEVLDIDVFSNMYGVKEKGRLFNSIGGISIYFDKSMPVGLASYHSNSINVNPYSMTYNEGYTKEGAVDNFRSILLHELQHHIQVQEGFSLPFSEESFKFDINFEIEKAEDEVDTAKRMMYFEPGFYEKRLQISEERLETLNSLKNNITQEILDKMYWRSYGEVEARNVQERMNMTPEQRRQTLLQETEDVAREDQLFLRNGLDAEMYALSTQRDSEQQRITNQIEQTSTLEETPITIKTPDSTLYNDIASNPILTEEDSLQIFSTVFTDGFKNKFGDWENSTEKDITKNEDGEPKAFYKTTAGIFDNYKDALDSVNEGEIELGYVITDDAVEVDNQDAFDTSLSTLTKFGNSFKLTADEAFLPAATLPVDTNPKTKLGFVNMEIKKGYIAPKKVKVSGKYKLVGEGANSVTQLISARLAQKDAFTYLGTESFKIGEGSTITIEDKNDDVIVKDGVEHKKSDLVAKIKEGKLSEVGDIVGDIGRFLLSYIRPRTTQKKRVMSAEKQSAEKERIMLHLMQILSDLGISVTTITNYTKNYKLRNGVDLSVEAIADIANNVIAFADGSFNAENLAEETAHIIIEAYENQDEISEALRGIRDTKEWAEYAEIYYEKYSKIYKGEELERAVEKEILGKALANKIMEGFATQDSFTDNLFTAFEKFVKRIKNFFVSSKKTQVDALLERLANLTIQGEVLQDLSNDNLMQSNIVLYSVGNQQTKNISTIIEGAIKSLERRANQLSKVKDISSKEIKSNIARIKEAQAQADHLSAAQYIIESLTPSITAVQKAIKSLEDNTNSSTREFHNEITQTSINYLNGDGLTMVETIRQSLLKLDPDSEQVAKVARVLQDMSNTIASFKGKDVFDYRNAAANILQEELEDANITEEEKREMIEKAVSAEAAGKKDISGLFSFFGGLAHVSNLVLKVLGNNINNVYYQAEEQARDIINPLAKKWVDKGWNRQSLYSKLFQRDADGKKTGMYIQERNESKHAQAFKEAKVTWFKEILGETEYNSFVEKEGREPQVIDLTTQQANEYYDKETEWKNENNVRFFLDDYYVKRQERYSKAGVSYSLREFLNNISARRQGILSKYRENGRVQYHLISKEDLLDLQELDIIRKDKKSEYLSATGAKKSGESLNDALALQRLDELTYEEYSGSEANTSEDFFDTMEEIEALNGREAAIDFFMANGGLTFSDEYWAEVTKEGTAMERMEKAIVEMEKKYLQDPNSTIGSDLALLEKLVEVHVENLEKRKQIIKQFGKRNNPAEVDTELMTQITMDSIIELDSEINDITVKINTILNKNGISLINSTMSETSLNESYGKDLADSGMSEFNFIRKHMTDTNRQRVKSFQNTLSDVRNNIYIKESLPKYMIKYLESIGVTTDIDALSMMSDTQINDIVVQYAKTKAASYYKRFSPPGYSELIEELRNSPTKKASDVIKEVRSGVNENVKIRVNFDWLDKTAEDDMVNPEYTKYSKMGYGGQIPSSKYQDDGYITMFNPDESGKATTNKDLFEMLEDMKEMNRISFDNYNIKGKSLYSAVKKSRQNYEKVAGFANKGVKEAFNDVVSNRIDEKLYGEEITDTDLRTIPQYFIDNLEDNAFISEDILHTFTSLVYESNLYRQKKHAISDALILQQTLHDSKFEGGKEGKDTNAYKMYKEFMDAYFYGVRYNKKFMLETPMGKVDFSRLITSFDKFQRHVNIAFNPFIAASSAGAANMSLFIEKLVGQDVHRHSYLWAKSEVARMIPQHLSEYGALTKDSTLYKLQEKFGLKELKERFSYTGYGKVARISKNFGFAMMEGLASPHQFDLLLSTLDDFRLVNDKFVTYNQFRKMAENKGKDSKVIKLEWSKYQKNSLYNNLDFKSSELKIKDEVSDRLGKEYTDKQMLRAYNRVVELNTNIDAVLNKTDSPTSTRHPIARVAMAHTGWLTLMLQRKFKGESINLKTGEMERGHYMSTLHYLKELYKSTDGKGFAKAMGMFSNIKETWDTLQDHDKRGIRRVLIDHATFLIILQLIAYGISLADDDDRNEDNWALHFTSFLYYRTMSEFGSSTLPFNLTDLYNKIDQPFMAISSMRRLVDGMSFDEIESGRFEGYTKFQRALIQSTHLRHLWSAMDVKNTSNSYINKYNPEKFKILKYYQNMSEEGKDGEVMDFFDRSPSLDIRR